MFKYTKSAEKIIKMQKSDGSWGIFHTLSEPNEKPITTEQALRRLEVLGYSFDNECIQRAVNYMQNCLSGRNDIPDMKEKTHDNKILRDMMLSTWIRKFTIKDKLANQIAKKWSDVISSAFISGEYNHNNYLQAYERAFEKKANGGRLVDFVNYYQVSLTSGLYSRKIEELVFDYILNHDKGIYYIGYRKKLKELPDEFASKQSVKFLASIELLTSYTCAKDKLTYVEEWIQLHKSSENNWDFASQCKDYIYLPLSESWRKKETRLLDSTYFANKILKSISIANDSL